MYSLVYLSIYAIVLILYKAGWNSKVLIIFKTWVSNSFEISFSKPLFDAFIWLFVKLNISISNGSPYI